MSSMTKEVEILPPKLPFFTEDDEDNNKKNDDDKGVEEKKKKSVKSVRKGLPERSSSFTSPKAPSGGRRKLLMQKSKSCYGGMFRRPHEIDGDRLEHWDAKNFETRRDASCRKFFIPKEGDYFFQNHLSKEDYVILRQTAVEQPFFSKYNRFFPTKGHFCCKACGNALYCWKTKIRATDGWPVFGACVDGSIDLIPAQVQRKRQQSAITIQRVIRGALCRIKVNNALAKLIEDYEKRQQAAKAAEEAMKWEEELEYPLEDDDEEAEPWDQVQVRHSQIIEGIISDQMGKCSSHHHTEGSTSIASDSCSLSSFASLESLYDELNEIRCHRCKSHLGNVVKRKNKGIDGQAFREHHRVNGRALKYVEDNLPKRINASANLLYANHVQQRLQGLQAVEPESPKKQPLYRRTTAAPFVSPRSKRRTVGGGSMSMSMSMHTPKAGNKKDSVKNKAVLEKFFLSRTMH